MPWVDSDTSRPQYNAEGQLTGYAGSSAVYQPESFDSLFNNSGFVPQPIWDGNGSIAGWTEAPPQSDAAIRERFKMAALGAIMGPGTTNGQRTVESQIGNLRSLMASDPRFAQYLPSEAELIAEANSLVSRQQQIDKAESGFDFGGWGLLGAPLMGIFGANGGFGNLFSGNTSGGGMFDWLGDFFGGNQTPVSNWADTWGDIGGLPNVNTLGGGYNAVASNDPIGALISNLESGMTPSQAVSAVEASMPGTTRSALEQFLYGAGSNVSGLGRNLLGGLSGGGGLLGGMNTGSLLGAGLGGLAGMMNGTKKIDDAVTTEYMSNPILSPMATNEMGKTIRGDYLSPDSNPWLKDTFNRGAEEIQSRLSPSFGSMEAFGQNSGWQNAFGRSLADLSTSLYGGNYQNERNRQFQATNSVPFGNTKYQSTPVYSNPLGGMFSGAMAGGLLGGKLFGG